MEDNKKRNSKRVIDADPIIMGKVFSRIGAEIIVHSTSETGITLIPNVYHKWGFVESLTLDLAGGSPDYMDEYAFEFCSGDTPTTLTLPAVVEWEQEPEIESNKCYQVSIMNNIGLIVGVSLL